MVVVCQSRFSLRLRAGGQFFPGRRKIFYARTEVMRFDSGALAKLRPSRQPEMTVRRFVLLSVCFTAGIRTILSPNRTARCGRKMARRSGIDQLPATRIKSLCSVRHQSWAPFSFPRG